MLESPLWHACTDPNKVARDGQCLGRLQHRRMDLHGEDGMALQRLAAIILQASNQASCAPSANRTWSAASAHWAVDPTWNQEAGAVVSKPLGMRMATGTTAS